MPKSLPIAIAAGLTVTVVLLATHGEHPAALAATPVSACQSVTPRSVSADAASIDRALRYANADARANGENGSYAVAARNSRDLLDRAKKRVEDGAAKLRGSDPRVTTYAEGGMIKEHVRGSVDLMTQAGQWALISAAYHGSTDARDAFKATVTALAEGHGLFAESGRCFLTNYL